MKGVAVLCIGKSAGEVIVAQVRKFLRGEVTAVCYGAADPIDFEPGDVIAVLSGEQPMTRPEIAVRIAAGMEYLIARRSIDYTRIQDLLAVPDGTEALLVNDFESSAVAAVEHLLRIGLDHIRYRPWWPGAPDCPELELAITPGERALVPPCARRVIDIGARQADISTIVELVQRLGLMDRLGDSISAQHLTEIARLLRENERAKRDVAEMRDTLQIVADHAPNGIVYTDALGRVILTNRILASVVGQNPESLQGRNIRDILPGMPERPDLTDTSLVLPVGGREMVARVEAVQEGDEVVGHLYAIESGDTIQDLEHELRRRSRKSEHVARYKFRDIVSVSPSMERVIEFARRASLSDSTILIEGESGTGKELIAQAIHGSSRRHTGPFVPVNFAAFPMSLLESELFGYEEGAFTGAKKGGMRGLFEEAHGGTIFLDEIGDAPLDFQVRLLRVLQERQVRPVGGRKLIPVDVRIIAATNKDLRRETRLGAFREDLYYRLLVLPLRMPSLRERREDILPLVGAFASRLTRGRIRDAGSVLSPEAIDRFLRYSWPGNVRQLMNAVEFLLSVRDSDRPIGEEFLPEYFFEAGFPDAPSAPLERLGPDAVWALSKFRERQTLSRRFLAELACSERPHLSESMIRNLLSVLDSLGMIRSETGRRGSRLTEAGTRYLTQWENGCQNGWKL